MTISYPDTDLFIDGAWRGASDGGAMPVHNPADGEEIGRVAKATSVDIDAALAAADKGFRAWRAMSAYERAGRMRDAAQHLRGDREAIARNLTLEQGKPLAEARQEVELSADIIDWCAEEGRRAYGRIIPPRAPGVQQMVLREPVGPVAGFTPWNVPVNLSTRKIASALGAGCSIILKGAEETPASVAGLVAAFAAADIPAGVVNLVFGAPAEISTHLITHPIIRKITFTGSTAVGKQLAAMAGANMKRATMELGGHAPAIVFRDADISKAIRILSRAKFRNAGQVCMSPTRFLIEHSAVDEFTEGFVAAALSLKVGDGFAEDTAMGPLANARRVTAMERFVQDALDKGASLRCGGERVGNKGNFFAPTVLSNVPVDALVMNEEPFGPIAVINSFRDLDEALVEANRLDYGLASYAYTGSINTMQRLASGVEAGMLSINHHGLGLAETPFGGVKESGQGSEGGAETLDAFLNTKFISCLA
jgi:succinate-semialdehyde dehydrogenase/glutarate-semialdehyde dehydrogenase